MHPLIARIHPAFRTALLAWLLSRSALWLIAPVRPGELGTGTPLPGLLTSLIEELTGAVTSAPASLALELSPWIILEASLLVAGIAVYRFARTTDLPQVAERACWLWFFNPLLAMYAFDWGTQMAAAAGTLAVAGVVTHRPRVAAVAAVAAVGCRLEFILLWPAIAVATWGQRRSEGDSMTPLALGTLVVPAAFSAWIAASWHLAGATHTSLRAIHGDALWRDSTTLLPSFPEEVLLLLGLAAAIVLVFRYLKRFPRWYALCALPALAWPLVQVPASFAAVTVTWALPIYVYLAIVCDDRAVGRAVMTGLVLAFVFAALQA